MKAILTVLIRAYQVATAWFPSPCRYTPSCSTYALEAIELHGIARGAGLAARRILRCHPWRPGGYDPVPPPADARGV
ncbi:MAG TPA: membrane protein insertion efficiency factor YidD [Gemmatimonadota bacterium]|nr:membrane protein insertion efficiency factor YidD [Gemmatimonadota bacterium]